MLKQRIALWALGLALPEMSALKPMVRAAMRSLALLVFAGLLAAVMFTGLLVILYLYLSAGILSPVASAAVVTGLLAALAILAWWQAWRHMRQLAQLPDQLRLFEHPTHDMLGDAAQLLASGFLEGLLHTPAAPESRIYRGEARE